MTGSEVVLAGDPLPLAIGETVRRYPSPQSINTSSLLKAINPDQKWQVV